VKKPLKFANDTKIFRQDEAEIDRNRIKQHLDMIMSWYDKLGRWG